MINCFNSFLTFTPCEGAAPVVPRYQFSRQIPIQSWHRIAAWCFGFPLYKDRVCWSFITAFCKLAGTGVCRSGIKREGEKGQNGGKSYCSK